MAAILPDFFEGKELSNVIGLVLAGSGFWGFVFSNVSGFVGGKFGWKIAYLLHLYAVIPLILFAVFIPDQPLVESKQKKANAPTQKGDLSPMIFVYTLAGMAAFMLIQVMWSNTSLWVTGTLGGTVAQAGMASGMMSLFSCIGRLFFGKIYGKLGRFTIHLDLALLIVGMAIASHSHSYAMALVALAFVGVSMALTAPAALNRCIEISPRCQKRAVHYLHRLCTGQFRLYLLEAVRGQVWGWNTQLGVPGQFVLYRGSSGDRIWHLCCSDLT